MSSTSQSALSVHRSLANPDVTAWVRFDAERSHDGLVGRLVERLSDESSLSWLEPLGFFGDTDRRTLVHALDGNGRDLDSRLESSVALGGGRAVELESAGDLAHVVRDHWSFVEDDRPAGVSLTVRTQRSSPDPRPAPAEVSLSLARGDLLAPPEDLKQALMGWIDAIVAECSVVSAGVAAKIDQNMWSTGQRMAKPADPFVPYVWDYSWVVLLPPACVQTLGGLEVVRQEAPVVSCVAVPSPVGDCLRLQVTDLPEEMSPSVLSRWREYLSPVLAPRRSRHRSLYSEHQRRFVLDDEFLDD